MIKAILVRATRGRNEGEEGDGGRGRRRLIVQIGLITAQDFKQALDNLGITFGSKAADKILVLMKFTPDGYIDYLKLGEEVENFMRYVLSSNLSHMSAPHSSPLPVSLLFGELMNTQSVWSS